MPKKPPPVVEMVREIEAWPVGRLVPYETNPRLHTKRQVARIAASILEYGFNQPIAVRGETIVAGHGRLAAAKELELSEVPVVRLDHLTENQAVAYCIADNRLGELSSWSPELLAGELEKLAAAGLDLEVAGFSDEELEDLQGQLAASTAPRAGEGSGTAEADPGPQDPPEKPTARKGDLWELGNHRLLCGSSLHAEDVDQLLGTRRPVLMATDPPYGVAYTGDARPGMPKTQREEKLKGWDDVDFRAVASGFLEHAVKRLRRNAPIYCWHASIKLGDLVAAFEEHDLLAHQVICWVKPTSHLSFAHYRQQYEPCLFGWRKGNKPEKLVRNSDQISNVWHVDWGKARTTGIHPTQKPLRLSRFPCSSTPRPGRSCTSRSRGAGAS